MNEYCLEDMFVGLSVSFEKEITIEMENNFRELSGDENPLHKDDKFAENISKGNYSKHVTFGMLTASLYSTLAGVYLPGKYSLIHSIEELSFMAPVYVGDNLTITGEVFDIDHSLRLIRVKATIRNQQHKLVSRAKMKILVMK